MNQIFHFKFQYPDRKRRKRSAENLGRRHINRLLGVMVSLSVAVASLLSGISGAVSHAAEEFVYETTFPALQQPWHFWQPYSIAATPSGNILVADTANHRIVKLNPSGQLITTWGGFGQESGAFSTPTAIAVDNSGYVYVLDTKFNNRRVLKFDENGDFISLPWRESLNEGDAFQFTTQSDIAISPEQLIYISDTPSHRILVFSAQGSYLKSIENFSGSCVENCQPISPSGLAFDSDGTLFILHRGGEPTAPDGHWVSKWSPVDGYLESFDLRIWENEEEEEQDGDEPDEKDLVTLLGMAIDNEGKIYIADATNHTILVYSSHGEFLDGFGEEGIGQGEFRYPTDIALDRAGRIFIADQDNNRIVKFSKDQSYMNAWQSGGSSDGEFLTAFGMTTDSDGNIWIADAGNHRIQKFKSDGTFLMSVGENGNGDGQFNGPRNVAVDSLGYIYVADQGNHRIQKFHATGEYVGKWGGLSIGDDGKFRLPVGLAIDSQDNVYVASDYRVQKFSSEGVHQLTWGGDKCDEVNDDYQNCFNEIEDIAVDENDNVYVTDHYPVSENLIPEKISRIQRFSPQGEYQLTIGTYGSGIGELDYPLGLDIDTQGNIYVCDARNYRIVKFNSEGEYVGSFGEQGGDAGQFFAPSDVVIGSDQQLFVLDGFLNRVQRFRTQFEAPVPVNKKAVIIAGGGPYPGNTLWNTTRSCANFAYRTLRHKGYAKDDIYYFSEDESFDIDGNGFPDDIYGKPTSESLQQVITQTVSDADELLLYFVDHGGDETFRISGDEKISAETVDRWLDSYEAASSGKSTLIYDACQSGSFIPVLTPYTQGARTVMTSSGSDEYAYFISFGIISFSEYFWTAVFNGHDVVSAFQQAQNGITQFELSQKPQIDANGNGIPNEDDDYVQAVNRNLLTLNDGTQRSSDSGDEPVIGDTDRVILVDGNGSATIEARNVTDGDGIERVWATIIPPDFTVGEPDVPVTALPEVALILSDSQSSPEAGIYRSEYNGFTSTGTYRVTIYARDKKGNNAVPVTTAFVTDADALPKAVIVTGQSEAYARTAIYRSLGDHAVNALKAQGFTDDRISLIHGPSMSQVESAVTGWASDNQTLILFVVGEGSSDGVVLNETIADSPEVLTPTQLKGWLTSYQTTSNGKAAVIIDADYSGQFIPGLANDFTAEQSLTQPRIVVTSTDSSGKASFESQGFSSYSSYFWNAVNKGANVREAFFYIRSAVSYLGQSLVSLGLADAIQRPQLDDNANGIPNEDDDGLIADTFQIGLGIITGTTDYVTADIPSDFQLGGEIFAMLTVENLISTVDINSVWSVITPPVLQEDTETQKLPMQYLIPDGSGRYQWMYGGFSQVGTYLVDFFVRNVDGDVSLLGRTTIVQSRQPETDTWVQVGGEQRIENLSVPMDQLLHLTLGIYPGAMALDELKHEWIVIAFGDLNRGLNFYLFSPSGLINPFEPGVKVIEYTFPFDHSCSTMSFGIFDLASIGLSSGEVFAYAHAYTESEIIPDFISDEVTYGNVVFLTVE